MWSKNYFLKFWITKRIELKLLMRFHNCSAPWDKRPAKKQTFQETIGRLNKKKNCRKISKNYLNLQAIKYFFKRVTWKVGLTWNKSQKWRLLLFFVWKIFISLKKVFFSKIHISAPKTFSALRLWLVVTVNVSSQHQRCHTITFCLLLPTFDDSGNC